MSTTSIVSRVGKRSVLSAAGSFLRKFASPFALCGLALFAAIILSLGFYGWNSARRAAEERLKAAAEDMVLQLDNCVDLQVAFIGWEITRSFGTPEAMRNLDLTAMMKTYFVDEINVVNADGLCIASTVPAICGQDQWSLANPARFCKALIVDRQDVFSQPFRNSATEDWIYRKYVGVSFPKPSRGYIQIGFDRTRLNNSVDYRLRDLAHSWHIGETGFFVISKTVNGTILSTRDARFDGESVSSVGFDIFAARTHGNVDSRDPVSRDFLGFAKVEFFESPFAGVPCLCTSGVVNQHHRYTAALPLDEVYGSVKRGMAITAGVLFCVWVIVVAFVSRLSDLVASLREKEREERERQLRDLTLAKTIQSSSLPVAFPDEKDYAVTARMETAREVGGDFYDCFTLPSGKICILIADVSGKGVPAALFMMRAKTTLRAAMRTEPSVAAAVMRTNDALAEKNEAEMFVTAWVGVFDRATGEVEFVNAGHNPPLIRRSGGAVEWVHGRGGLVLAAMHGIRYRTAKVTLASHDSLFLYTDGVTEAMNGSGELYGEERLERALRSCGSDLIADLRTDLTLFVAGAEPSDDITMLTLDYK